MAQEEDATVQPFTPTHHLRDGFLSFTEFLLRNVEEWSKPHAPWPPPPPPIAFSGSDRFIKGRLPHRTFAISASLSSLFDDAETSLLDVCNHGVVHAHHDCTPASTQDTTRDDTLPDMRDATHGDDHRAPTANIHSIHVVSSDNVRKSDTNCMRSQVDEIVQGLSSNGMVDVSACSADNALEASTNCMHPQGNCPVSANEMADVATRNTDNLLAAHSQDAKGHDDGTVQLLHEDDGRVQPLYESGLPSTQPDGLDCTKELDGSVYVPDNASLVDKNSLRMQHEEGCPLSEDSLETLVEDGNVAIETPVDVVAGLSLLLECKSSLSPSILTGDEDGVANLYFPSSSKSPNYNNLTGVMGGVLELSLSFTTKSHNNNSLAGDADGVAEVSLLSPTKNYNDNNLTDDTDELSLPSKSHNDNNLTDDKGGASELSLPSTTKSHNENNLTGDADGVADLPLPSSTKSHSVINVTYDADALSPPTESHDVNILQNTVMEAPVIVRQDEQVDDLEEGEISEMLADDECLDTVENSKAIREAEMQERHPLDANRLETKALESTTDDEMNQPISLFISRYRTRSSVNPSSRKLSPLDTNRDSKKKRKSGNKRKIEEQEQVLKEIIGADMAVTGKSRQAKCVQKGSSKVARTCARGLNDYNGGLFGVGKVSIGIGAKVDTSEAKEGVQNTYGEFGATQAGRDQVVGTPTSEREDGASRILGEGLTQNGLARSEHFVTLEKHKVWLPMVVEEDLSTINAGNDQKFSQAEVVRKKPKCEISKERKKKRKPKRGGSEEWRKKRQQKKHRKWGEKQGLGIGKISLKPCLDKQKEKKACHFYVRGKCDKGASCPFSHDVTPITKSEMCKYFINNCCLKGDDCPYSHILSTFPCKYFHTRGKCIDADSCRFSHEPISEEAKQKLLTKVEQEQQVREGNKVTVSGGLGRVDSKHAVSPSDLELFPLGGKHANKTPLKGKDAAASKISLVNATGTSSTRNNVSEIPMLIAAKKAASTFTGGLTSKPTCDPTGPSPDKSSEKSTTPTTQSTRTESGGLLAFKQERKTKVEAFLQSQLDNSHLMHKSKLGMGLENFGGCYTLLDQPRALSMGQTSLLKVPNTSPSSDLNARTTGLLQASEDHSQPIPNLKPTTCADTMPNSDFSVDQRKCVSNGKSIGIDASLSKPSVLGPSLLDIVSMSQRATVPKGPAFTSGLLSPIINTAPKRSTANVFLDRFLKG